MASGIIYILVTPFNRKLLKIGKTTRTAEERAAEVSSSSGVPAPFWVVYDTEVKDCDEAEKLIHNLLAKYRYHKNREFFELPLKEAISAVIEVVSKVDAKYQSGARYQPNSSYEAEDQNRTTKVKPVVGKVANMVQILGPNSVSIKPRKFWEKPFLKAVGSFEITDKHIVCGGTEFDLERITSVQVFENKTLLSYALLLNTMILGKPKSHGFYESDKRVVVEVFRLLTTAT